MTASVLSAPSLALDNARPTPFLRSTGLLSHTYLPWPMAAAAAHPIDPLSHTSKTTTHQHALCPLPQPTPCKQYIVRVTDEATLPQEPERPEVRLSEIRIYTRRNTHTLSAPSTPPPSPILHKHSLKHTLPSNPNTPLIQTGLHLRGAPRGRAHRPRGLHARPSPLTQGRIHIYMHACVVPGCLPAGLSIFPSVCKKATGHSARNDAPSPPQYPHL